jgi:methylmalonyl-CoA mutase N-terminal domain/subunit
MSSEIEKLTEAYLERVKRPKTWSGIPVKEMYTPDDVKGLDYQRDLGNAGDYPFTRGIYPDMYRGRFWTTREVCGFGTPADTNKWLKFHMCSIKDMDEMTEGIPLDKVSFSLISADPVTLAAYIAVAQNRGLDISTLMGTIQNEPLHSRYCAADPSCYPLDLSYKLAIDIVEYCARYVPRWVTGNVNLYNLRETGITAAQEIAFGFAFAIAHIDGALKRGLKIDEFANRRAFYCSAHIDFFEEIAKLRAARRMWAKIMKEKYHAQDPKSWKFRFAVHTAGSSLVYQQPLNNIIRVAYEALAAVLAGAQSLHACSFDEPVALPTKESQRIAVRTQQILAYETGVGNVVDPLGGSYYVESLTNKIEEEATRILEEIVGRWKR